MGHDARRAHGRSRRQLRGHVSGPRFQVTATFAERAGQITLTFRMRFETAAERAKVKTCAVEANEQNFDRLATELARLAGP